MSNKYNILPFNYRKLEPDRYLAVNTSGDYYFLSNSELEELVNGELRINDNILMDLENRNFIASKNLELAINLSATKYRTRKGFLKNFTALHMMVITVRCNQKCEYCQVSCESDEAYQYDMNVDTAAKIINCIFKSPSHDVKIEFQGGEPLLNWKTITFSIEYAENINKEFNKEISFVVCTNLTLLTPEKLKFLTDHNVSISTSLDGPMNIHDSCRKLRNARSSYSIFKEKLSLAMDSQANVSALMTTSKYNINCFKEVVDEYIKSGFTGIFFRPLNPYGFAHDQLEKLGYPVHEFLKKYCEGIDYIIGLNLKGHYFVEYYAQILLTRILTSYPTGFVDLQSPSGAGICGVIYDFNGDVYPSDEGRMLSRMGDMHFKLGNVAIDSYERIFAGEKIKTIIKNSCIETTPLCGWCPYQIFCGVDPVRNYLETNDIVGFRPNSFFCDLHIGIFDYLFNLISSNDDNVLDIIWSWVIPKKLNLL